jgi:hypothetical protein
MPQTYGQKPIGPLPKNRHKKHQIQQNSRPFKLLIFVGLNLAACDFPPTDIRTDNIAADSRQFHL